MATRVEFLTCAQGGLHEWTYLGKRTQGYGCGKCGAVAGKIPLKVATDIVEVPSA